MSEKVEAGLLSIYERVLTTKRVKINVVKIERLGYFHTMLNKQIDLVERRVLCNEIIQAEEEEELSKTFKKLRHKR